MKNVLSRLSMIMLLSIFLWGCGTNDAMEVFGKVLEKFFDGERDEKTLKLI